MQKINRVFLGWDQPLVPLAVDYLLSADKDKPEDKTEDKPKNNPVDLRHLLIATPVARAAARLLELLVIRAEQHGRTILPPHIVTRGVLVDLMAPPSLASPPSLMRALLWSDSLHNVPLPVREAIIATAPPAEDLPGWIRLGALLDTLDLDLATGTLSFEDVVVRASSMDAFSGHERWHALAQVRRRYSETLDRLGLDDGPSRRRKAIADKSLQLPHPATRVVMLGCADLDAQTISALEAWLEADGRSMTALVHAPDSESNRFDQFGVVIPAAWHSGIVGDISVVISDDPSGQAACVAGAIDDLGGNYAIEDIVVGVPDTDVVSAVRETLDQFAVPTHDASGVPMNRTGVYRLLNAACEYLESRSFDALAALARHPDVGLRVDGEGSERDWRTLLDQYQSDHVPYGLGDRFLERFEHAEMLASRRGTLDSTLGDLRGGPRPLSKWADPIVSFIIEHYGQHPLKIDGQDDRVVIAVATSARDVLHEMSWLPAEMTGLVSAATAIRIVVDCLAKESFPEPPQKEAIELLGWLELSQDDAPVVLLTGFNDGFVPGSLNEDPFLPNAMRRHLGLADNTLRFARDAFYLSALLASREHVKIVAGRNSQALDRLKPSRLWLCCQPEIGTETRTETGAETVARRVLAFYQGSNEDTPFVEGSLRPGTTGACLPVPLPRLLEKPIEQLSVTAFGAYLACPYRFYLQHVLKLCSLAGDAMELSPISFGNLAHAVLNDFGRGPEAASQDAATIFGYLGERLDEHAQALFGENAHPAVYLQVEQLRARFEAFARWQAQWAASGKCILFTEKEYADGQVTLQVDDRPFGLIGRIDRIDRDDATGTLYVFDYKLSSYARLPEKDHVIKGEWRNLQLPLYRRLVADLAGTDEVKLGYITLSDSDVVQEALAEWTDAELQGADEAASQVVRAVRAEQFWPPTSKPRFDDFATICQELRLGGPVHEELSR